MTRTMLAAGAALVVTLAAQAEFSIEIDPAAKPVKDVRTSTCGPEIGYAGASAIDIITRGALSDDYWFVTNRVETARAMREAGAWHQRMWNANDWFALRKPNPYPADSKDPKIREKHRNYIRTNPDAAFRFWKENGFKIGLTLEVRGVPPEQAKSNVLEFVQWIVDNGYKDVVSGFELGNENYFRPSYPSLAPVWTEIVNEMVKIWPDVKIGIAIAENFELNPDLKQVRSRMLGEGSISRDTYFAAADFNRYTAQFIVAMSNCLDKITHITFHAYGGDAPYSCSYWGVKRLRGWCEAFPEIKDKKWWFTEVRLRSDEDQRCQRLFRETLVMSHFSLMAIMQPELDGFNHHQFWSLAGGLYLSNGRKWAFQMQDGTRESFSDFRSPYNAPRLEVGSMGVARRIFTEGILQHPLLMAHGTSNGQGQEKGFYTSGYVLCQIYKERWAVLNGKGSEARFKAPGEVEWVAALNAGRDDLCLLMVNTKSTAERVKVTVPGKTFAAPAYRTLSCPGEFLDRRELPGEGKPWRQVGWEDTLFEFNAAPPEKTEDGKEVRTSLTVAIAPHTVQSVTVHLGNMPKPKK